MKLGGSGAGRAVDGLEIRRKFIRELGADPMEAHQLAMRSLEVPAFNLRDFQRQRFRLAVEMGDDRQDAVDADVLRSIDEMLEQHEGKSPSPSPPSPPRNIDWHGHMQATFPVNSMNVTDGSINFPKRNQNVKNNRNLTRQLKNNNRNANFQKGPQRMNRNNKNINHQRNPQDFSIPDDDLSPNRDGNIQQDFNCDNRSANQRNQHVRSEPNSQYRNTNRGQFNPQRGNQIRDGRTNNRNPNMRNANAQQFSRNNRNTVPQKFNRNQNLLDNETNSEQFNRNPNIQDFETNSEQFNRNERNTNNQQFNRYKNIQDRNTVPDEFDCNPNIQDFNRNPNSKQFNRNSNSEQFNRNQNRQDHNRNSSSDNFNRNPNIQNQGRNTNSHQFNRNNRDINRDEIIEQNRNNQNWNRKRNMEQINRNTGPQGFNNRNLNNQDYSRNNCNSGSESIHRMGHRSTIENQEFNRNSRVTHFDSDDLIEGNRTASPMEFNPNIPNQMDYTGQQSDGGPCENPDGIDRPRIPIDADLFVLGENMINESLRFKGLTNRGSENVEHSPLGTQRRQSYQRIVHDNQITICRTDLVNIPVPDERFSGGVCQREHFRGPDKMSDLFKDTKEFRDEGRYERNRDERFDDRSSYGSGRRNDRHDDDSYDRRQEFDDYDEYDRRSEQPRGRDGQHLSQRKYDPFRGSKTRDVSPNPYQRERRSPGKRNQDRNERDARGRNNSQDRFERASTSKSQATQDRKPGGSKPKNNPRDNKGAGQKRGGVTSPSLDQKRRKIVTNRNFIIGGYRMPYINNNRRNLPQPEEDSLALTFFEQQPNFNTHFYAANNGRIIESQNDEPDTEISETILLRMHQIWTKVYRQKNYKDWEEWWKDYKWCGIAIEKQLTAFENLDLQKLFEPKLKNNKDMVNKVLEVAFTSLKENTYNMYSNMYTVYLIMSESFLDNLDEDQMERMQDIIRHIPNHLWIYKMRSMVNHWRVFHDCIMTRTSTFVRAVDELKCINRIWEDPVFHWLAKQAYDELKTISAIAWPDHNRVCVKSFKVNSDEKFFINVCQAPEVPAPEDVTEEELIAILESTTPGSFRVPMSISEPRHAKDRADKTVDVCDIAINPQFLVKIQKSQLFKNFFLQIVVEAMSEKYNVQLATDKTIILNNRKFIGTLVTHRVRNDDAKRTKPQAAIEEGSVPAVPEASAEKSGQLVEEINEKDAAAFREKYHTRVLSQELQYKLRARVRENVVDEIFAEIYLPKCVSSHEVSLDIGEDRILVEALKHDYLFDKFVNYRLYQERAQALFDKTTKMLQIRIPVHSQ